MICRLPQVGDDCAEQDRATHRGQRILGPDQESRRWVVAHALHRSQDFGKNLAALGERGADGGEVVGEAPHALLGVIDLAFECLDALADADQRLGERRIVLLKRFDFALQFLLTLGGEGDVTGDGIELGETCIALSEGRTVPEWVAAELPSLPEVMRLADGRASQYEAGIVSAVEAALLEGSVGKTFDAVVIAVDRDRAAGSVELRDPAVTARCDGPGLPLGEPVRVRCTLADVMQRQVRFALA